MKTLYLLIAFVIVAFNCKAQISFEKMIPGQGETYSTDVVQTPDSGYVVSGYQGTWNNYSFHLIKTDPYGNVTWDKTYGSCNNGGPVENTSDGGLITAAQIYEPGFHSVRLIRTDAGGNEIFNRTYACQETDSYINEVRQCYDGGFAAYGTVGFPLLGSPSWLVRLNADGDTLWEKIFREELNGEKGIDMICTDDSGFVIMSVQFEQTILRKLDKNGEILWVKHYGGGFIGSNMCRTSDDGYIMCGSGNDPKIMVMKLSNNGDSLWTTSYLPVAIANSIEMTYDGGFFIGGTIYDHPVPGQSQMILFRTDEDAGLLWSRNFGGAPLDEGYSLRATSDSGYIFTGIAMRNDSVMIKLIKDFDEVDEGISNYPDPGLKIFPVPSKGDLTIQTESALKGVTIEITDLPGNRIFLRNFPETSSVFIINTGISVSGMYMLKISSGGNTACRKVVFER